jgi:hypothetical protein
MLACHVTPAILQQTHATLTKILANKIRWRKRAVSSWNDWGKKCNPYALGLGGVYPFDQGKDFKAMEVSELTKGGCCMTMTVRFFDHYCDGVRPAEYLKWLKGAGTKDIIDKQTVYINHSNSGLTTMKALVRMVEDDILANKGYSKVEHMWFPTLNFSRLADDSVKQFGGSSRVFKPIYFANASTSKSHAMGIILDEDAGVYYFFDPNEGIASFKQLADMRQWVEHVQSEYDKAWSAYFLDTWSH